MPPRKQLYRLANKAKSRPYGFWTAYRQIVVETGLARGESRDLIAAKLGVTKKQLADAICRLKLKPRDLLDEGHG